MPVGTSRRNSILEISVLIPGLVQAHEEGQLTVLAMKGGRVGDWAGRELSTLGSSKLELNPDLPEAAALRRW